MGSELNRVAQVLVFVSLYQGVIVGTTFFSHSHLAALGRGKQTNNRLVDTKSQRRPLSR